MVTKTPSAWAVPDSTPAHKPAADPLVVVYSEAVSESEWSKVLPTSPKGFAKLAKDAGWIIKVTAAKARNSNSIVESWSVKATRSDKRAGVVAVWEQQSGDVAQSKTKCHVTTAYCSYGHGIQKSTVTELKNIIKGSM